MKPSQFNTPIVLIIYNRPETTKKVFEKVAGIKPRQLFLVADGPRPDRRQDAENCEEARRIVQSIDWDCSVQCNFSARNLGAKMRVSSGLDWAFSYVDRAILLEDDCIPNASFFLFCQELLQYYEKDPRIMMIGGTNYQFGKRSLPYSYYFSIYTHIWGWATWASAWEHYDGSMAFWPEARDLGFLEDLLDTPSARRFWIKRFQATYEGKLDAWDYCWTFACWLNNGLSVIPSLNLVSNIGFGKTASNTIGRRSPFSNMEVQELSFPLSHPPYLARFSKADQYTQRTVYREHLLAPLKKRIKLLLGV